LLFLSPEECCCVAGSATGCGCGAGGFSLEKFQFFPGFPFSVYVCSSAEEAPVFPVVVVCVVGFFSATELLLG
jgi:hypothetical protein